MYEGWRSRLLSGSLQPVACAVETVTRFNTSAVNQMTRDTGDRVWKFYGLFQLTSGLTCSDDTARLPNICGANCTGESGAAGFSPLFPDQLFTFLYLCWVKKMSVKYQLESADCPRTIDKGVELTGHRWERRRWNDIRMKQNSFPINQTNKQDNTTRPWHRTPDIRVQVFFVSFDISVIKSMIQVWVTSQKGLLYHLGFNVL